jgi:hypothetical protein
VTSELAYVVALFALVFVGGMLLSRWLRTRQLERVQLELEHRRRRILEGEGKGDAR